MREQWRENESGPVFLRESVAFMTRKGDSKCLIGIVVTRDRWVGDDPTRVSNTMYADNNGEIK